VDPNSGDELTSVLAAITAATEDRDVTAVLQRVVEAACTVANARYGALGVVGEDGTLSQFVHTGLTAAQVKKLGALPRGGGVLGLLLTDPKPVRLTDLSAHPDAGGFPAHHPVMTTFLGTPIRVRGEIFGNLYLTEKRDGTTFTALDEARIVALSALAGAAIANNRQLEQLQTRERWRDAVVQLAVDLIAGESVDAAYEHITHGAKQLCDGPGACVAKTDGPLRVLAAAGHVDDTKLAALSVADVPASEPMVDVSAHVFGPYPALWIRLDDSATPLLLGAALTRTPTRADQNELASFARTARLALARQRAAEEIASLELVAERERIGRDLHDTVIQELFATGLSLQALARRSEKDEPVVRAVNAAVDQIDATVKQIRSTIFSLHDTPTDASVRSAVMRVTDELSSLSPAPIRVSFNGAIDTMASETVVPHLIAVLREALTNVVKHANATLVHVTVDLDGDMLVLSVNDNGVGVVSGRSHGHGLHNMTERATTLGGTCEITSADGGGTRVVWQVPAAS
jgi:signal transduction histidine kinase